MAVTTTSKILNNFPFDEFREGQAQEKAFESYKYVIVEAPTGSGKSALGLAAAMAEGSSYICVGTKDLQQQYKTSFKWVQTCKGRPNFICEELSSKAENTADHAPCLDSTYECSLKTRLKDYYTNRTGTKDEKVNHDPTFNLKFSDYTKPCSYFHQRNIALAASHSVFNYSMMLALGNAGEPPLVTTKKLLILDEAHTIPSEVVKFLELSISKYKLGNYIDNFIIPDLDIDDITEWLNFLIDTRKKFLNQMKVDAGLQDKLQELERNSNTDINYVKEYKALKHQLC